MDLNRHDASTRSKRMNLFPGGWISQDGPLMDHGIWKWIKSYRARGRFNSRRVYSSENEPGRWSSLASRVESTAYCELLLVNPLSLSLSLFLFLCLFFFLSRTLVAPVSKRGGSFYNRIYRRHTGGTTKRTYEEDASGHCTTRDLDCLEIALYEWALQVNAGRKISKSRLDRVWVKPAVISTRKKYDALFDRYLTWK